MQQQPEATQATTKETNELAAAPEPNIILSRSLKLREQGHNACFPLAIIGMERIKMPPVEQQQQGWYAEETVVRKLITTFPQYKRLVKKGAK
jgi:hypothetical protein